MVSHKQGNTVGLHLEHLFKLMGQVGRCVKCRAAGDQFSPQVKEENLRENRKAGLPLQKYPDAVWALPAAVTVGKHVKNCILQY